MPVLESPDADAAFIQALASARARLQPPAIRERVWPALAAAAFFALAALIFATAAILAPPARLTPIEAVRGPL
ncbi:MAG TPA: hypothetical protein VHZ26_20675 [Caulobacteraceae bacterium]|jgi:hypothetical protein|nr:hypothetical protein [Caulobacteraceae bacterium]